MTDRRIKTATAGGPLTPVVAAAAGDAVAAWRIVFNGAVTPVDGAPSYSTIVWAASDSPATIGTGIDWSVDAPEVVSISRNMVVNIFWKVRVYGGTDARIRVNARLELNDVNMNLAAGLFDTFTTYGTYDDGAEFWGTELNGVLLGIPMGVGETISLFVRATETDGTVVFDDAAMVVTEAG